MAKIGTVTLRFFNGFSFNCSNDNDNFRIRANIDNTIRWIEGNNTTSIGTNSNSYSYTVIFPGYNSSIDTYFVPIMIANNAIGNPPTSFNPTLYYYDGKSLVIKELGSGYKGSVTLSLFDTIASGLENLTISTDSVNSTINCIIDGANKLITNIPISVPVTNGQIVIDTDSHMPKDSYSVNINNGDNMLKIVDGDTQYNSFPATITVNANKAITAYGEPSPTITVNYENTSEPVVTNS